MEKNILLTDYFFVAKYDNLEGKPEFWVTYFDTKEELSNRLSYIYTLADTMPPFEILTIGCDGSTVSFRELEDLK